MLLHRKGEQDDRGRERKKERETRKERVEGEGERKTDDFMKGSGRKEREVKRQKVSTLDQTGSGNGRARLS